MINDPILVEKQWERNMHVLISHASRVPGPMYLDGGFFSNPFKAIKAFVSHPAKTIAHDITAKKIVKTVKTVAPIAAGAAALYFGVPYLASAAGKVGATLATDFPTTFSTLSTIGSTASKFWSQTGSNISKALGSAISSPAINTAANRAGTSVADLLNYTGKIAPNVPTSVALQGQGALASYLANQQLQQQGVQMSSAAAQNLLDQRLAAEQATMGAANAGSLPYSYQSPSSPPIPAKSTIDWTKIAPIGIGVAGLLVMVNSNGNK